MSEDFIAALRRLLDYVEHDERKNFEEQREPENHIYRSIVVVRECLNKEILRAVGSAS